MVSQNTISLKTVSLVILSLLIFFNLSCGTKKNLSQEDVSLQTQPKLIFLNYTISKNEDGHKQITFLNKIITDGKLKNNNYSKSGFIGDLICTQLDEYENPLQNIIVKNPLSQVIEFVNDSLNFEKKQVNLKNNELSLRLQLHSKTKSILLSEIIDSLQTTKELILTNLN